MAQQRRVGGFRDHPRILSLRLLTNTKCFGVNLLYSRQSLSVLPLYAVFNTRPAV